MAGQLHIQLQDRDDVVLGQGELFVVPEGFATARSPMRRPTWCFWNPMSPSTPVTPSWPAQWANGSIDR